MARAAVKDAATAKAVKLRLVGTIGGMTDEMFDLREKKRALEAQIAEIEEQYKAIEEKLMERLEAEGTDKGAGKKASCSITSSVVANVTDWDEFGAFILKHKYLHLLQRRVSDPAVRELFETKGKVPGVEPFTKKKLNLRVI
jgi:hypothetical protein